MATVIGAAAVNAGFFAVANWALGLMDKRVAAEERERHDRVPEEYQKKKLQLDQTMERLRLKLERETS